MERTTPLKHYSQRIGRLQLHYEPNYGEERTVTFLGKSGWNESSTDIKIVMSLEELRDLRYLIGRILDIAR